jgi:exonuclease SbcC
VAGQRYVAARVVRADGKGGASTKEARLERDLGPDVAPEVMAGDADGVTQAVQQLLGLTYEHFTTCVVLPQGEFARFLHHKPSERQGLLVRLLELGIYARMGHLAGERAALAKGSRDLVSAQLEDLADRTVERRAALEQRQRALDRLVEEIDASRPELDRLTDVAAEAQARADEADGRVAALGRLSLPAGLDELAEQMGAADHRLASAQSALEEAEQLVAAAEDRVAAGPSVEVVETLLECWRARGRQSILVERGERAELTAVDADEQAEKVLTEAEAARKEAEQRREQVRVAHLAADLASGLAPGDDCPVCGRPVDGIPAHDVADLAASQGVAEEATRRCRQAEQARRDTAAERARVEQKLVGARERLGELAAALEGGPSEEEAAVDVERARAVLAGVASARQVLKTARTELEHARDSRTQFEQSATAAWDAFDAGRDRVASLEPPRPPRHDLAAAWKALLVWAQGERPRHLAAAEAAHQAREQARIAVAGIVARFEAAAGEMGVAVDARRPVRDVVVAARATAQADLAAFDADLERAVVLRAQLREVSEAEQVANLLANQLRANAFQKWLLDEALVRLVDGASGILHQLSLGAYALTLDRRSGNFAVVDHHNADTVRSVRTLSGGETFLASLALALSLADQVVELAAGGSARLESIFLDEGFGTLDPETLDTVAAAIEELGSQGRMVGLVSHVRDLAERLPIRFEVRKGPTTATVERVSA